MRILYSTLCLVLIITSNISCVNHKEGLVERLCVKDSLYTSSDYINLSLYTRVHKTNDKGYVNGHAQVDSNFIYNSSVNFNRTYFFEKGNNYIGEFKSKCKYNDKYIRIQLDKDILKEAQGDMFKIFGEKIKKSKKHLISGKAGKGEILENFPNEIYIKISEIDTITSKAFTELK